MPKLIVKNSSYKTIERSNKVFPPRSEKETFVNKNRIAEVDACKSLDWKYADPLMELDFENIKSYTSLELKEFAQKAGVKNYSTMLKDDLIKHLEIKKGIREPEVEEDNNEDNDTELE